MTTAIRKMRGWERRAMVWFYVRMKVHSMRGLECWVAALSLAWGLWLMTPFDTFGSSTAFRFMESALPESTWGLLAAMGGAISLVASLNAFRHREKTMRKISTYWIMLLFMAISGTLCAASPLATGWVTYLMIAIGAGVSHLAIEWEHP